MIKVELGHLGVVFDCLLERDPAGEGVSPCWVAEVVGLKEGRIVGWGASPVLAIEALRSKFYEEEK